MGQTPSRKRGADAAAQLTPQKRVKPALAEPLAAEDLPTPTLASITMTTTKQTTWKMVLTGDAQNPAVFLLNNGSQDISFQQGNIITAYGKIKWRFAKDAADIQPNEIPYTLKDSDTWIFHDNKEHTDLKTVVSERRKAKPAC